MAHRTFCLFLTLAVGFILTTTGSVVSNVMVTPPPDMPKWTVRDDNNNICMLMAMNATLTAFGQVYPVPQSAEAYPVSGSCRNDFAYFSLSWPAVGYPQFTINILFNQNGGTYKMDEINGTAARSVLSFFSWSQRYSFASAAVGHSITCDDYAVYPLYFSSYQFQPFAQQSNEEFGQGERCSDSGGEPEGMLLIVIIAAAVGFLLLVGVIIGIVVFLVRRKRKQNVYAGMN